MQLNKTCVKKRCVLLFILLIYSSFKGILYFLFFLPELNYLSNTIIVCNKKKTIQQKFKQNKAFVKYFIW